MSTLNIAVIQMDVALGEPDANLKKMESLVREAAQSKVDVIVLPETWNTGYFPKNIAKLALASGINAVKKMGELAKTFQIYLVGGSISEVCNKQVVNTTKVFNRDGLEIASYQKIHLFSPGEENKSYTEGNQVVTFRIEEHLCGVIICYDLKVSRTHPTASSRWCRDTLCTRRMASSEIRALADFTKSEGN